MSLSSSLKSLSHHAYLLIGSEDTQSELLSTLEKNEKIKAQGNSDFFQKTYETFTIDDARELRTIHNTRPVGSTGKKIFVIRLNGATIESQNALLKLLEEPAEYAHFFLIVPSANLLLPTVRSRMQIIVQSEKSKVQSESQIEIQADAQKFLKMSPAKRLEFVKKLVEDISKEKKTKQDAINFLNSVQSSIHSEKGVKDGMKALESIEFARDYMNDRAPSVKMLLEYVALSV